MMKKRKSVLWQSVAIFLMSLLSSCANYLDVKGISYLSIRSNKPITRSQIPTDAEIIVICGIDEYGNVEVEVQNNSDEIMIIDRTKSFFCDKEGVSKPYYDPTVNVLAHSTTSGHSTGVSVNLGSVAKAVGVGGTVGTLLNGVNVGSGNENSSTTTNTTYIVDQPSVSIAPHSKANMGRVFQESYFGIETLAYLAQKGDSEMNYSYNPDNTFSSCKITISYSVDGGLTFEKVETLLYSNSLVVSLVNQTGHVNDALRSIYMKKSDLFDEEWFTLCFGGGPQEADILVNAKYRTIKTEDYNAWKGKRTKFYNYK